MPQPPNGKTDVKSLRKSVLFLGAVMVAYILYVVLSGQFEEFTASLAGVDPLWVARGALCMVCYYLLGVVGYAVPVSRDRNSPLGFRDLMSVEAAGIFFSFLSPGGTGAAPAQIYRLTRAGLSVGSSSALQYTRFIVYEAAEGIFAAVMLIFRYRAVRREHHRGLCPARDLPLPGLREALGQRYHPPA